MKKIAVTIIFLLIALVAMMVMKNNIENGEAIKCWLPILLLIGGANGYLYMMSKKRKE